MSIDCLDTKVIVRRVGVGAAPFTWEVVGAHSGFPLHVSSERFRSMEAAYNAGQDRLVEYLPGPRVGRGEWRKPAVRRASAPAIDWRADEADENRRGVTTARPPSSTLHAGRFWGDRANTLRAATRSCTRTPKQRPTDPCAGDTDADSQVMQTECSD
jgi:hypothetical protein